MKRQTHWAACIAAVLFTSCLCAQDPTQPKASESSPADVAAFELADGDRVALVGATYLERMQSHGYLETLLACRTAERDITFRNLGWSGDTARGHARALFGKPDDGFTRLINDLKIAKPTVIVLCYGANEAYGGEAEAGKFASDMNRLIKALEPLEARVVVLSPTRHEKFGGRLPDPAKYNAALDIYTSILRGIAEENDLPFIDFRDPLAGSKKKQSSAVLRRLTYNSLHFSPYGYWLTAPILADALGTKQQPWSAKVDLEDLSAFTNGVSIEDVESLESGVSFTAIDAQLPFPALPKDSPIGAELLAPQSELVVAGLPEGRYGLEVDGEPIVAATHEHWAEGVKFRRSYAFAQVSKLREQIGIKNELFFHRVRPQNETYLLLFRKHEQGNNAVEIPQYDPLVEEKEAVIHNLTRPKTHRFRLVRLEQTP